MQMYVWGVAFNALGAWLKDGKAMAANGILSGFSATAWSVVVLNALNGLAISAVLKYANGRARAHPPTAHGSSPVGEGRREGWGRRGGTARMTQPSTTTNIS